MATERVLKADPMEGGDTPRVLVFTVDDGFFGIHLDWAEAVYQREAIVVHSVRTRVGGAHAFLSHRGEPAFILDLRRLLGLHEVLGDAVRSAFVVVRSGTYRLALSVDELVGVESLDLGSHVPVASSLVRDGGLCVGHLVAREDGILVILDPNRLLDGAMRDTLEPALRSARASLERSRRIEELWATMRKAATLSDVRNYARLCRRGGRSRAANAARSVLKFMEPGGGAGADTMSERLIRDLLGLAEAQRTGEVVFELPEGRSGAKIVLQRGRVVDAQCEDEWGVPAFRKLLDSPAGAFRFMERESAEYPGRIADSTVALMISSLQGLSEERRGRRER
jgi:chemotaxis signal transduction protein